MKLTKINLKQFKLDKNQLIDILKSSLLALIITLLAVLIFGIVLKFVDLNNSIIMPINQVIKVSSVLIGCLLGFKNKTMGALKGGIMGLIYTLISLFIFLIIGGSLKSNFSFIDLLLGIIIGIISGIISVNTGKKSY